MTTLTLLDGTFEPKEGIELIRNMLRLKIQFHENKINGMGSEEDVEMRERRIKALQRDLDKLNSIKQEGSGSMHLSACIQLSS